MEITEEEFMFGGTDQVDDDVLMEAWPIPSEESLKEFEELSCGSRPPVLIAASLQDGFPGWSLQVWCRWYPGT